MEERSGGGKYGWLLGLLVAPLMLLCCGGPVLVAAVVSLGLGAWFEAHGLWLLGGVVIAAAIAATSWWLLRRRRRAVDCCSPGDEMSEVTSSRVDSSPSTDRSEAHMGEYRR